MINNFEYVANSARVIFGVNTISCLASEVDKLGCSKALVLCTPTKKDLAQLVKDQIVNRVVDVYANATMHTPVEVTNDALIKLNHVNADCVIAIGGGSTIGLSKALALRKDVKQIAIPTTYAGSEMTPIIGQTENGIKTTQKTSKVLPETVIYDVNLSVSLPIDISITSGINALAHAVEALYAQQSNPITNLLSESGIKALFWALPKIYSNANNIEARTQALYGAWLCSIVLGSVGMALHHKICHTLGGSFNLSHAKTHTIMLPHTAGFNSSVVSKLDALSHKITNKPIGKALFELITNCGGPYKLKDIGMKKEDITKAASLAMTNSYYNPRPFNKKQIYELLSNAFEGDVTNLKLG